MREPTLQPERPPPAWRARGALDPPAARPVRALVAWALVAPLTVALLDTLVAPAVGEALPLRWIRLAAEHPVRLALAGALLAWALRPAVPGPFVAPRDPRAGNLDNLTL